MLLTKVLNYIIPQLLRCFGEHCNEMDCIESNYGFSSVTCDQTIEQTLNRDSKVKGGLVSITLNHEAMHRWILGQAELATIMCQCETMVNVSYIPR